MKRKPGLRLAALSRPYAHYLSGALGLLAVTSAIEAVVIPVLFTSLLLVVVGPSVLAERYTIPLLGFDLAGLLAGVSGSTSRGGLMAGIVAAGVLAMVVKALSQAGRLLLAYQFSFGVASDLRSRLFAHLLGQSASFFEKERTGALLSGLTNDIHVLQEALGPPLFEVAQAPLTIAMALGLMLSINWQLTLATLAVAPLVVLALSRAEKAMRRLTIARQDRLARLNGHMAERLASVQMVQAFGREEHDIGEMRRLDSAYFREARRLAWFCESIGPASELVIGLGMLAGLALGGLYVLESWMPREHFILFFAVAPSASTQLGRLARVAQIRQQIAGTATRLFALLDIRPAIADEPGACPLAAGVGRIRFDRVSFAYGSGPLVLQDITLEARAGEMLAIVGPSGAGKTTLVRLLLRFFDPTAGRVLYDGIDIRSVTLSSLRAQIGYVSQDAVLLNHSVRENIAYGRPGATEDDIRAAAGAAHAVEFIEALPSGWDTIIGERGVALSGGQRQRLAIARALLRDPRVLVLDEATSALDSESERLVQEALEALTKGRTTFVIAHRLGTVRNANRIAVLDRGRIAEVGTHIELLARSGLYRRLYEAQFVGSAEAVL